MPTLTAAELTTLRSQHPSTAQINWYLALAPYGLPTFTAQVNDAGIARGERTITYDNDVGEGNVQAGMTLWVGSTSGTYDIGRVRIKSIDVVGNTITVAENDDILWVDDAYLSCPGEAGYREIWGIFPRMTEVAGVVTFFEDYDIQYNDPVDDVLPPKANGGPPICAFLNTDGYIDVSFTGDQSYTTEVGAAIASYAWNFSDGVIQSGAANVAGTCAVPNVVRFSTAGFRYVSLTVTDNTAQSRTGTVYVPVWIFHRTSQPPLSVEVLDQSADPSWKFKLRAFATNDSTTALFNNFPDGALCVLFTETVYPDGSTDIGGFCHHENIRFMGWLEGESIDFNHEAGTVAFDAVSHDILMDRLPGFAFTLETDTTPSDWYEVDDLNVDRALHALLERRTTVNQVCHVERVGEGATRTISVQPFPETSIYKQAQEHLLGDCHCQLLSDRQGILRATRDPQFLSVANRAAVDIVCTLTTTDWINDLSEVSSHVDEIGHVRIGGFQDDTPLLSQAPGEAYSQQTVEFTREGYIFQSQAEANLWSFLQFTASNNPYPTVPVELAGYWPVFDPAFQEYAQLTTTDPLGRNVWTNQKFIVRGVKFRDLMSAGTCVTELTLEMENDTGEGVTVAVPEPPEPLPPPPPPPFTPPAVPDPVVAIIYDRHVIWRTNNFDALNPTWVDITGVINVAAGFIASVECDIYGGSGAWCLTGTSGVTTGDAVATQGLWWCPDITIGAPVWTLVYSQLDGSNDMPTALDCRGAGGLGWGQMRSVLSTAANECFVAEHANPGLTPHTRGESTRIYRVDSGGTASLAWDDCWGVTVLSQSDWEPFCDSCPDSADFHAGDIFFGKACFVNQSSLIGSHQLMPGFAGATASPIGMYAATFTPPYCYAPACGDPCVPRLPWPEPCVDAVFGWPDWRTTGQGARHAVYHRGMWWGIAENDLIGGRGVVYSTMPGNAGFCIWSNSAYDNFTFCNMASNPEDIFWCEPYANRRNELYIDAAASGLTSEFLFGTNAADPGDESPIGHIRAVWNEDRWVVLLRKRRNDIHAVNSEVIYVRDSDGNLLNKTGNLVSGDWWGTGRSGSVIANENHTYDNVGFSSFEAPLR